MSAALGIGSFVQGLAGGINAERDRRDRRALTEVLAANTQSLARTDGVMNPAGGRPQSHGPTGMFGDTYGAGNTPTRSPRGAPLPTQSASANPPHSGAPRGASPSVLTEAAPAGTGGLFSLIDAHEGAGDYTTLFGHSQRDGGRFAGTDVTQMTIGEVLAFQDTSGEYGRWVRDRLAESGQTPRIATPAGRHQIVGTTLRANYAAAGLSLDDRFDAAAQDRIAAQLARNRLARAETPSERRRQLRAEWEGFRNVPDAALDAAITEFMGAA